MSGHSHAKTVRRTKEASAKQRSQAFAKVNRLITVAVRQAGPNPEFNPKLRLALEMARSVNMPKENVERAIQRASGADQAEKLEEVTFEAYGPGGVALIIEGITDNKNRTLNEIKQILNEYNGKLAGEGSVRWLFERKGCITIDTKNQNLNIKNKEELEIAAIEAGAEDIYWHEDLLDVYTKPEDLEKVKKNLEEKGIPIESASLDWVPKENIKVDEKTKQACQKLFEVLDENDAVQNVYSNLE